MTYKQKYDSLLKEFEQYKKEAIKWSVEDFTEYGGYKISKKKAQECLEDMIHHHDCNIGITWDTIQYYLETYGKRIKKK